MLAVWRCSRRGTRSACWADVRLDHARYQTFEIRLRFQSNLSLLSGVRRKDGNQVDPLGGLLRINDQSDLIGEDISQFFAAPAERCFKV